MIYYIWLSLFWGMAAWILPLIGRTAPQKRKLWLAFLSGFTCALALINVLWDVLRMVKIGDWGALEDTVDALTVCSVILVLGTFLLNWKMLYGTLRPRPRKHRYGGLYVFCAAMGIYVLCLLPYLLPFTSWLICSETGRELYPLLLFVSFVVGYVTYLQHTPGEKLTWGIPIASALFSLVQNSMLYGLRDSQQILDLLSKQLSIPVFLIAVFSTAVLRFLYRKQEKKKGVNHEQD